jgi:hypothetical protein
MTHTCRLGPIAISLLLLLVDTGWSANEAAKLPAVDDALRIARAFVRDHAIDVSHHHITSARIEHDPSSRHPEFWRVTWELLPTRPVKGGQVFVHIYSDGSAGVFYGE